jgi:hypothetical protein
MFHSYVSLPEGKPLNFGATLRSDYGSLAQLIDLGLLHTHTTYTHYYSELITTLND